MGRVLVEAFAAGVPVVAFAVGGIPEVVSDGETGFLVRDVSPQALAGRIRELLYGDAETLRKIARDARRAWEERYTVGAFQERVTDLMAQVAS